MRKDEKIEETIKKILRILYKLNIPIKILNVSNVFEYIYSIQVEFGDNLGIKTNGKGCSFELALASALAEGMERIQTRNSFKFWYSSKCVPQKYLYPEYITDTKLERELEKYFEKYKTYKIYKFRLDFYELKTKKVVSLPDRLINLLCGSNGLCAGNTEKEAIVQGTCEIFERYVRKLSSKGKMKMPYIDEYTVKKNACKMFDFFNELSKLGYRWKVLDCTIDNKYPVIGFLLLHKNKQKYIFTMGSDIDFEIALERCVTEMFQGKSIEDIEEYMNKIEFAATYDEKIWSVYQNSSYYAFIDNYINNMGENDWTLFFNTNKEEIPSIFQKCKNNEEAYDALIGIIDKLNINVYIFDYSYLGFCSYRVYIPELSDIFEFEEENFEFIDDISNSFEKIIHIKTLERSEKQKLVKKLVSLSSNFNYRRNSFEKIMFKFLGKKDFDFNYLYLDFVISLIYIDLQDFNSAYKFYKRFSYEHDILSEENDNQLLKVIYIYLQQIKMYNKELDVIYNELSELFDDIYNRYVYINLKNNTILSIVYWPNCPECINCIYSPECKFNDWEKLNNLLVEKQRNYYQKRKEETNE